jgi:hypothetical protein
MQKSKSFQENSTLSSASQINSRSPLVELDQNSLNSNANRNESTIGIRKLPKAEQTQRIKMKKEERSNSAC